MQIKIIDHNTGKTIEYDHVTKIQPQSWSPRTTIFEVFSEVSENVLTCTQIMITITDGMKPVDIIKIEDGKEETARIL